MRSAIIFGALLCSAIKAAEGARVVRVVTVLDRREGATEAFAAAGLDFKPLLTIADFGG
jgi:orotate phosphoribosyltransferase